ncbi:hypothetical protein Tco_1558029, partial [Tanacetum coccineum]
VNSGPLLVVDDEAWFVKSCGYPVLLQSFDLPFYDFNGLFHKLELIVNVNSL